jgi:signal transduction histidine kinase
MLERVAVKGDAEAKRERLAAIGEIAAEVAHELRNALQIISANAYLAKQDLSKSGPQLTKIERSARLAHGIVDDLMALARGEPAHAEPVLFVEVVLQSREDLPERGAEYDDRITPAQLEVRAHQGLLSRCLHVLYENAIAASAPRVPTIETKAWAEDGRVVIEVADDGPGVPEDIASSIFEPLVTGRAGGTGLGLALARRVVAAHAGTIALVPNAEGVTGARFRVELPTR